MNDFEMSAPFQTGYQFRNTNMRFLFFLKIYDEEWFSLCNINIINNWQQIGRMLYYEITNHSEISGIFFWKTDDVGKH